MAKRIEQAAVAVTGEPDVPGEAAIVQPDVPGDPTKERPYYIVNPAGAVHGVSREHAKSRLRSPGYRMATAEEIAALERAGGFQRFDRPIATPWSPAADVDRQPE